MGAGKLVSTPGGIQSVSLMRFMQPTITIHAGETVEWDSSDVSGHTITFGQEPPNYGVTFPSPGNYRLVCLIHTNMTGLVHVLPPSEHVRRKSGLLTA